MKKSVTVIAIVIAIAAFVPLSIVGAASSSGDTNNCANYPSNPGCPCNINPKSSVCAHLKDAIANKDQAEKTEKAYNTMTNNIINTLLFGVGIMSLIMIIISGIRWASSGGNAERATKARQALTYSVIGLVVAILAFAIVRFVLEQL
jgi:hypothetical protein